MLFAAMGSDSPKAATNQTGVSTSRRVDFNSFTKGSAGYQLIRNHGLISSEPTVIASCFRDIPRKR
jgi:hypothetical protein